MYYINIMPRKKSIDTETKNESYSFSNKHICYFEKPKLGKDIIELYIYDSKKKIMNYYKK